MTPNSKYSLFTVLVGFGLVLTFQNCSLYDGGSTTGNPFDSKIRLQLESFVTPLSVAPTTAPLNKQQKVAFATTAAGGFELDVCIHSLSFKYYISFPPFVYDEQRTSSVLGIGNRPVLAMGTPLGNYNFFSGEYNQFEILLQNTAGANPCNYSLRVTNSNGEFTSNATIRILYFADYVIGSTTQSVEFPAQFLANAMAEANAQENACVIDVNRPDCIACTADPLGPNCLTIERLINERNLGVVDVP